MREGNEERIVLMKKGIIFDLDGTLWDSSKAVVDSWNEKISTFDEDVEPITYEQMQGYMGKPMDEIAFGVFHKLPRERALELLKICELYENEYIRLHGGVLYPQLEEVLAELQKNYFLAIVSNCQIGYIEAFLEHHQLGSYFSDTENYGNTLLNKAENIRLVVERNHLERAVYVGDIMSDYQSAVEAGLPFIHAAYGFGNVPEGTPGIGSLTELPSRVREVLGED